MAAPGEKNAAAIAEQIRTLVFTKKNPRQIVEELRLLALHPPNEALFGTLLAALRQLKPQKSEGEENKAIRSIYQYLSMLIANGCVDEGGATVAMHALGRADARDADLPPRQLSALQLYAELAAAYPFADPSADLTPLLAPVLADAAQGVAETTAAYIASGGLSSEPAGQGGKARRTRLQQLWAAPSAFGVLSTLAGTSAQPHALLASHIRAGLCSRDGDVSRASAASLLKASLRAVGPQAFTDDARHREATAQHNAQRLQAAMKGGAHDEGAGLKGAGGGGVVGLLSRKVMGGGAKQPVASGGSGAGAASSPGDSGGKPVPPLTAVRLRDVVSDTVPPRWQVGERESEGGGGRLRAGSSSSSSSGGGVGDSTPPSHTAMSSAAMLGQPGVCLLDATACVDYLRACAVLSVKSSLAQQGQAQAGGSAVAHSSSSSAPPLPSVSSCYSALADAVLPGGDSQPQPSTTVWWDPLRAGYGDGGCTGDAECLLRVMAAEEGAAGDSERPVPHAADVPLRLMRRMLSVSASGGNEGWGLRPVPPQLQRFHAVDASGATTACYNVLVGALKDQRPRVRLEAVKLLAAGGFPRMLSTGAGAAVTSTSAAGAAYSSRVGRGGGAPGRETANGGLTDGLSREAVAEQSALDCATIALACITSTTALLLQAVGAGSPALALSSLRAACTLGAAFSAWEAHLHHRLALRWGAALAPTGTATQRSRESRRTVDSRGEQGGAPAPPQPSQPHRYAGFRGRPGPPIYTPSKPDRGVGRLTCATDPLLPPVLLRLWALLSQGMVGLVDASARLVMSTDAFEAAGGALARGGTPDAGAAFAGNGHLIRLALCAVAWCTPSLAHAVPSASGMLPYAQDADTACALLQRLTGHATSPAKPAHIDAATAVMQALFPGYAGVGQCRWGALSAASRASLTLLADAPLRVEESGCTSLWTAVVDRAFLYRASSGGCCVVTTLTTLLPLFWLGHGMGVAGVWGYALGGSIAVAIPAGAGPPPPPVTLSSDAPYRSGGGGGSTSIDAVRRSSSARSSSVAVVGGGGGSSGAGKPPSGSSSASAGRLASFAFAVPTSRARERRRRVSVDDCDLQARPDFLALIERFKAQAPDVRVVAPRYSLGASGTGSPADARLSRPFTVSTPALSALAGRVTSAASFLGLGGLRGTLSSLPPLHAACALELLHAAVRLQLAMGMLPRQSRGVVAAGVSSTAPSPAPFSLNGRLRACLRLVSWTGECLARLQAEVDCARPKVTALAAAALEQCTDLARARAAALPLRLRVADALLVMSSVGVHDPNWPRVKLRALFRLCFPNSTGYFVAWPLPPVLSSPVLLAITAQSCESTDGRGSGSRGEAGEGAAGRSSSSPFISASAVGSSTSRYASLAADHYGAQQIASFSTAAGAGGGAGGALGSAGSSSSANGGGAGMGGAKATLTPPQPAPARRTSLTAVGFVPSVSTRLPYQVDAGKGVGGGGGRGPPPGVGLAVNGCYVAPPVPHLDALQSLQHAQRVVSCTLAAAYAAVSLAQVGEEGEGGGASAPGPATRATVHARHAAAHRQLQPARVLCAPATVFGPLPPWLCAVLEGPDGGRGEGGLEGAGDREGRGTATPTGLHGAALGGGGARREVGQVTRPPAPTVLCVRVKKGDGPHPGAAAMLVATV